MNLLDTASLVVTPNGYKASKLYSIVPTDGTGDMTFARTGDTATRVNSSGLIETVLANKPRLDYLGGGCPKLLLEPQRTNLLIKSQEINDAAYTKYDVTVLANDAVAPDGTTTADKVYPTTSGSSRQFFASTGISTGVVYSSSVFAKAGGKSIFVMFNIDGNNGAFFNLSTGTVSNLYAGTTATITPYENGWFRCTLITTSTTFGYVGALLVNSTTDTSITANATDGIYFWGAQLEAGAFATSYISTTTASVTRNGEGCEKSSISSLIGQTEGTVFFDVNINSRLSFTYLFVRNAATSNYIGFAITNTEIKGEVLNANATQANILYTANLGTGRFKLAISYKANDFAFYVNGALVGTDTSGTVPTCDIYQLYYNSTNALGINSGALWKTRLSNAELATLTTI